MITKKAVHVEWIDSAGGSHWHDPRDQDYKPHVVESVGWVLQETKESLTLCTSMVFDEKDCQAMGDITIPTVAIKSITLINYQKPTSDEDAAQVYIGPDINPDKLTFRAKDNMGNAAPVDNIFDDKET